MRSAISAARFTACMRAIALLPECREMPKRLATPNIPTASTTNATSISTMVNPRGRAGRCCIRRGSALRVTGSLLWTGAGGGRGGTDVSTGRAHANASGGCDQHGSLDGIRADRLIASDIAEQDVARRVLDSGGACESGRTVHLDAVIVLFDRHRAVEEHVPLEDRLAVIKLPGVGAGPGGGAAILEDDPSVEGAVAARGNRCHGVGHSAHDHIRLVLDRLGACQVERSEQIVRGRAQAIVLQECAHVRHGHHRQDTGDCDRDHELRERKAPLRSDARRAAARSVRHQHVLLKHHASLARIIGGAIYWADTEKSEYQFTLAGLVRRAVSFESQAVTGRDISTRTVSVVT